MATGGLYGSTSTGTVAPQSGSESVGLYGNNTSFGGSYFEWFIFQISDTVPATPTGGSWSFTTNTGTAPAGWLSFPPANPTNTVWVSVGLVNSKSTASISWSAPGKFSFSSGLPIISGSAAPVSGDGQTDQLYIQTGTTPQTIWFKQAGTWVALTGSTLYMATTGNQTIAGIKTFSSPIAGSVTGTSNNVTGIVAIENGGTGSTTNTAARTALGLGSVAVLTAGAANGAATLDAGGTVPLSQIPASIQGGVSYQGAWNASTNTPTLTSSVGTKGYYYVVSTAGSTNLNGVTDWNIGDWAIFNGSIWQKIDNTDAVTSVNGLTGTVVLTAANVGAVGTIASADGSIVVTTVGAAVDLSVSTTSPASVLLEQVRNTTGATLTKGTAVYISGATGQIPTVSKALATNDATSAQTLGLITSDLANNANGFVTIIGLVTNLDTSAYTDGQQLYLSPTTAGTLTATKPYAPQHLVYMAVVSYAHPTQGKLIVKVQNGYELDELHDVSAQSPTIGQTLVYNSANNLWEKSFAPVISGTTVNNTTIGATTASTGAFTTLSASGTTTLSGNQIISVTDNSNAALRITQLGTGNALLVEDSTNPDSSPFVIDATGQVIIGSTTQYGAGLYTAPIVNVNYGNGSTLSGMAVNAWGATGTTAPRITFARSSGSLGTYTSVVDASNLGGLFWHGADGTAFIQAASISASVDGTPGTNDMPGRLVFSTTADGASSPTERMRINSSGNVGIGTTVPNTKLEISANNEGASNNTLRFTDTDISSQPAQQTGRIEFYTSDSSPGPAGVHSYILSTTENTNGLGALSFGTGQSGSAAERMRIDSSGNVLIATTTAVSGSKLVVSGADANIHSLTVGRGAGAVDTNTAVGASALAANSTGANNTAVGQNALLSSNASGLTAVGRNALRFTTSGANNTAVGTGANQQTTTGASNSSLGFNALLQNTTGSNNTAIGDSALVSNSTANNNTAVGYQAVYSNTTGTLNTAIGSNALRLNTTGNGSTAVGSNALNSSTGNDNNAFGQGALYSNTTGVNNVAMGGGVYGATQGSLGANTSGSYNTAVGVQALLSNTTASNNVAVGYQALDANTTGATNTALGTFALGANTTGANSTAVGYQAGLNNTTGEITAIGRTSLLGNTTGSANTAVGVQSLATNSTGSFNTALGRAALISNTTASNNTALGWQALYTNTTGANNTAVGFSALELNTTASNNTAVGYQAGYSNTTGSVTALGYQAAYTNSTGASITAIGQQALQTTTVSDNTAVGTSVLRLTTTGNYNTAVGGRQTGASASTLENNTTGSSNSAFGNQAMRTNTTGSSNTAIGFQALQSNTTGGNNIAVGYRPLSANTTGQYNTAVGKEAGFSNTTGQANAFFGYQAGYSTTGDGNTFVGAAGTGPGGSGYLVTTGSRNTILGAYTGSAAPISATGSNFVVLSDGDGNVRAYWDSSGNPILATGTSAAFNGNSGSYTVQINGQNTAGANAVLNLSCPGSNSGTLTYIRSTSLLQAQNGGSGGVTLASGGTAWVAVSDERQKENLVPIADAITKVSSLRSVTGNYIADEKKTSKAFLIAQDVEAVFPEAVDKSDPDVLGLAYTDVIPLLVAAIKEQTALINSLKARLDAANL
jgi:hypothetical protein